MSKVKLDLRSKSDTELQQFAETHLEKLVGNPNFPTPLPGVAEYAAELGIYTKQLDTVRVAFATYLSEVTRKEQIRDDFTATITKRGDYVQIASDGDAAKILSAGFEVRDENRSPIDLVVPAHLQASLGDHLGEIDLTWDVVKGARTYVIECRLQEAGAAWRQAKLSTRSSCTIPDLQSGKTYAFRVRAIGAKGESEWSDETSKTVR